MKVINKLINDTIKYDDRQIEPSVHFITSCIIMMREYLLMMHRLSEPEFKECWMAAGMNIYDVAYSDATSIMACGLEDYDESLKDCNLVIVLEDQDVVDI